MSTVNIIYWSATGNTDAPDEEAKEKCEAEGRQLAGV